MLGFWLALAVPAADGSTQPPAAQPEELVRQLADEKFDSRQQAHDSLAKLGMDAFGALTKGLSAGDPEVARRCRELLDQLRVKDLELRLEKFKAGKGELPGYERYVKVTGENPWARGFFADMWSANPMFLAEVEDRPERSTALVNGAAQNIMQNLYNRPRTASQGPPKVSVPEVAALLFAVQHPKLVADAGNNLVVNLMSQPQVIAAVKETKNGESSPMHKLALGYMRARFKDPMSHNQLIHMCMNLEIKECMDLAEVVLGNRGTNQHGRGLACALIGKFGTLSDAHLLAKTLDDTTHINQFQFGRRGEMRGTTQVRDVALAQLVAMTKQSHKDYGFPFAEQGQQFNPFNTYNVGFTDNEKRKVALTKWKAYASTRPELQSKTPLKEEVEDEKKKKEEGDD